MTTTQPDHRAMQPDRAGIRALGEIRLVTGDSVTARNNLGRVFRAPVPRGTSGVVTARAADGAVSVYFINGYELLVDPTDVQVEWPTTEQAVR